MKPLTFQTINFYPHFSFFRKEKIINSEKGTIMVIVKNSECVGCEECLHECPQDAIIMDMNKAKIIQNKCDQCKQCIIACPVKAIKQVYEPAK